MRPNSRPDTTLLSALPCVWVTAGVLSYRLCDREFDCETCPLHSALRGGHPAALAADGARAPVFGAAGGDDPVGRFLATLGAGCTLHLDRAYSDDGLWMETTPSGEVRIGLDDYTLRLLQPVDEVVLPRIGSWLPHGAPCAWVYRGRLAIPLRCPVAGEVAAVHPHPTLAPPRDGDVADDRWWFRVRPHEPVAAAAGLFRNEALLGWYLSRVRTVHEHLDAVVSPVEGRLAGPLMNDGGTPTGDLEAVLGRERFEALVAALFPMHI
jgi:glycine cleavage system H lipoate-binding protein